MKPTARGRFTPPILRNINLLPLLALLTIACTQDDNGGQPLPDGEYPMTFTAAGIALSVETKATTDNNWQGVQTVAVLVDGEMKPYTVNSSGDYQTATLTSDNPFYWQNTAPIQVSAWWPYTDGSTDMPAVVVQADQSEETNFHKSDYICAENQQVEFGGTQTLQFTHRTAKVVVNPLVAGDDMTDAELQGATVALVGVTTGSADNATVTPYADGTDLLALLPGQQIAADEPFIRISLANGTTYSYKPDEAITLQAGYQYTYTITVNKTGLSGSTAAVSNWDKGAEIAGVAEPVIDFTLADDGSYIVYTAAGLLAWAAKAQKDLSLGCTLADDIDMSGQAWTPIGDCSTNKTPAYTGTFDGAGHTIRNLSTTSDYAGLFGGIRGGTIKNLTLENPQISGNQYAGGIVTILQMNSSTMENCHVSGGSVTGGMYTGAIAGFADGTVRACSSSSVKVSGIDYLGNGFGYVGGIVGYNYGRTSNLYSCYAAEPLLTGASGFYVGAIAGGNEFYTFITACFWSGDVATGVSQNYGTFSGNKVDGTTYTWQSACDAMNAALPADFGWQWTTGDPATPPVLVKK